MNKIINKWTDDVFFGTDKKSNERIYLSAPSWDCDWYRSFGFLGNKNCHYHLNQYQYGTPKFKKEEGIYKVKSEPRNQNLYDSLLEDYDLNPCIKYHLWEFCELILTAYIMKDAAEVLGKGGSRMSKNNCKDIIINKEEVTRINEIVLPSIFNEIHKLIIK